MFSTAMKELSSAAVFLVLLLLLVSPALAFAQIPPIVPCDGVNCRFCDIAKLAQNVLNGGIYIAVFLSAILFAYAGWQYLSAGGEPGKASEAKKIFWNVGVGLLLILAAWLIVDLIIRVLAGGATGEIRIMPWNEVC